MNKVSIALATYNGGRFIQKQLASFSSQDRLPDELVVTDDNSSDDTIAHIERFAANAPFEVRLSRNPTRLGYTRNFERAISLTKGDVVFISDQDDVWYPKKISLIMEEMKRYSSPVVTVNDQLIVDAAGSSSNMTMFGNFRRAGCPNTDLIAGSCTAFPSSLLPILLPIPDGIPYDSWIGAVADSLAIKKLIEEPLQVYRRHGDNATQPIVATSAPSQWSAFRRYGFNDPREGWAKEIAWRGEFIQRLQSRFMDGDSLLGAERGNVAIELNRQRIAALQNRLKLLEKTRWARLPEVIRLWRRGLYSDFLGLKSAAKDLLRP